ncbi:MAG TPA: PLP-dependent aminotransferase family protein [Candidatus Saccharimonadales bacterium]|nr:PLP-dependent aminotransferase family protein [Candidatus Saccharimonadales bacterium]
MKKAQLASPLSALAQRTQEPAISWLMKMTLDHPNLVSLAAGFTDNSTLPVQETLELLEEIFSSKKTGQAALQYGSTAGDACLRRLTAHDLQAMDNTADQKVYQHDRVLITHGSQQLLYLVTECLCNPGDIVLLEDPTYFVYLGILQSHGVQCRGTPMESDGLDLAALQRTLDTMARSGELQRVKMLYLVSYFQNPSGITTSYHKKAAALELLNFYEKKAGHPIYLLEDAAYRELRFKGDDEPSALSVREYAERVIYAGTYTKPFATGARVGFGVLPEPVGTAVRRVKGNHDFGTANLLQQLLAHAVESGIYERHLALLQRRYAEKAGVMVEAIDKFFPKEVLWEEPRGGLYVWAKMPRRFKTGERSKIFETALKKDVLYVPGELCYGLDPTRGKPNHEMRLSFGGATEEEIRTGIERLGKVLKKTLRA